MNSFIGILWMILSSYLSIYPLSIHYLSIYLPDEQFHWYTVDDSIFLSIYISIIYLLIYLMNSFIGILWMILSSYLSIYPIIYLYIYLMNSFIGILWMILSSYLSIYPLSIHNLSLYLPDELFHWYIVDDSIFLSIYISSIYLLIYLMNCFIGILWMILSSYLSIYPLSIY